jgi:hypothetical protein
MSETHSYVTVEIGQAAYQEIRAVLDKAGYQHTFINQTDGRELIDMRGLAVTTEAVPRPKTILVNGKELPFTEAQITYEQVVALAYPNSQWDGWSMTFFGKLPGGGEMSGLLSKGKCIRALDRMSFTVVDTSNA